MIKTSEFDQQALTEQERLVGRQKVSGEPTVPQDPISHVMKTNPGRPEDMLRRFLRRGYALLRPRESGPGRGLVFIAFGRSLSTQVEFVRRAWINNEHFPHNGAGKDALITQFAEPRLVCGGYYFVHYSMRPMRAIARGLQEHGPAFGAWVDICDRNREAMDDFDDAFVGHYDNLVAYADYLLEDLGYADAMRKALPAWLLDYVRLDPDQFGRDLDASGQVYTAPAPDGGIWIFDSNYA